MVTRISSPEDLGIAEELGATRAAREILEKFTAWGEEWVVDLRSSPKGSAIGEAIKVGKLDAIDYAQINLRRVVKEVLGLEQ